MSKPSRWDRPPEPHDWRWAVAHVGRAMVTTGVLMFGFVAYQLWGTGLQTSRAQDRLQRDFDKRVSALSVPADTNVAGTTSSSVTAATGGTAVPPPVVPGTTVATEVSTATTSAAPTGPLVQHYGMVRDGEGIGRLMIPRIGLTDYYVAGVGKSDLASAVGHFPRSVAPGQLGNAALAGHRTTHGAPFSDLDALQPGDEIDIQTVLGGAYVYIVTGSEVVDPSDYGIVTASDPSKATLTLITCTPKWSSTQRLVVHADLDATRSGSPVGVGQMFYGEAQPDSTLGAGAGDGLGDEVPTSQSTAVTVPATTALVPVTTAPQAGAADPIATVTMDAASVASTAPTSTTTSLLPAPTTTVPASVVRVGGEFASEAFQQGWFDDAGAIPHVLGWGALFGLIWFACYRLARRFRNLWLGIAVSIVPVVVVLYFMYENIERLLPAAL